MKVDVGGSILDVEVDGPDDAPAILHFNGAGARFGNGTWFFQGSLIDFVRSGWMCAVSVRVRQRQIHRSIRSISLLTMPIRFWIPSVWINVISGPWHGDRA